jgi:hypothetical protein
MASCTRHNAAALSNNAVNKVLDCGFHNVGSRVDCGFKLIPIGIDEINGWHDKFCILFKK